MIFSFYIVSRNNKASKIYWLESVHVIVKTACSPTVGSFLKQRKRWISKSTAYIDQFSILLGIVTFATILLQVSLLAAGLVNHFFLLCVSDHFSYQVCP